jgi:hypothetical protein
MAVMVMLWPSARQYDVVEVAGAPDQQPGIRDARHPGPDQCLRAVFRRGREAHVTDLWLYLDVLGPYGDRGVGVQRLLTVGEGDLDRPTDHLRDDLVVGEARPFELAHDGAIAHDAAAVTDLLDLGELVRDVEDACAASASCPQMTEDPCRVE